MLEELSEIGIGLAQGVRDHALATLAKAPPGAGRSPAAAQARLARATEACLAYVQIANAVRSSQALQARLCARGLPSSPGLSPRALITDVSKVAAAGGEPPGPRLVALGAPDAPGGDGGGSP